MENKPRCIQSYDFKNGHNLKYNVYSSSCIDYVYTNVFLWSQKSNELQLLAKSIHIYEEHVTKNYSKQLH